jgi:hypothetical protein
MQLILILDVYPTHRTDRVVESAAANDVELLFVPAGATGRFQPLDRRVFRELKARARAEFGRWMWRAGGLDIDYDASIEILARCWAAIAPENVKKAWNVLSGFFPPGAKILGSGGSQSLTGIPGPFVVGLLCAHQCFAKWRFVDRQNRESSSREYTSPRARGQILSGVEL